MNRFELVQTWPQFINRVLIASGITVSRSAPSSTKKASIPPSSSNDFFRYLPASAATCEPARSEPVRQTPATRGSLMNVSLSAWPIKAIWKAPLSAPPPSTAFSNSSPLAGTLLDGLMMTALPTIKFGANTRIN